MSPEPTTLAERDTADMVPKSLARIAAGEDVGVVLRDHGIEAFTRGHESRGDPWDGDRPTPVVEPVEESEITRRTRRMR